MCSSLLLASPPAGTAPPALPSFESCEQLAAREPESEATARCFDQTGAALKQTDKARTKLQELLRQHPGSPWPTFFLIYRDPKALTAALPRGSQLRLRGGTPGERWSPGSISIVCSSTRGGWTRPEPKWTGPVQVAQASGNPELIARARVLKARHLWGTGKDLEGAYLLLRQAEPALFPNGAYSAQRECLLALANLNLELGRYQEGLDAFRRLAELAASEAGPLCGGQRSLWHGPRGVGPDRRAAQRRGPARGCPPGPAGARLRDRRPERESSWSRRIWMLGVLSKGEAAREPFRRLPGSRRLRRGTRATASTASPASLRTTDPREAQKRSTSSLALARQAQDPWSMAFAWREQMRVSWAGRGRAVEDSRSALDAIEALRDLQAGSSGKAEAFSTWSEDYYWLSGRLIDAGLKERRPENLEQAFQVAERLRARSLIDTLEAAHAVPAAAAPIRQKRGAVAGADLGRAAPAARSRPAGRRARRGEPGAGTAGDRGGGPAQPARPHRARPRRLPPPRVRHPGAGAAGARRRRGPSLLPDRLLGRRAGRLRRRLLAAGDHPRRHPRLPPAGARRAAAGGPPLQRHLRAAGTAPRPPPPPASTGGSWSSPCASCLRASGG